MGKNTQAKQADADTASAHEGAAADAPAKAEAEAAAASQSAAASEGQPAKVKARVLMDCAFGKVDDVVEVTEAEAAASTSQLDAHPDAVAYAESLKKDPA